MRIIKVALLAVLIIDSSFDAYAYRNTKGYSRKDGTYVKPHYSSTPNSSKFDNWSTRGNVNPFTGKKGYTDPYKPRRSKFGY